jgi:hypothetical protein
MRSVALRVLALAGSDVAVALEYLRWKGRPAEDADVRSWDAALLMDDRRNLLHPLADQPRAVRQLAEASKFMAERRVVAWVKHQNEQSGLAPTPGAIVAEFADSANPAKHRSSRYKWLRRVSSRWGGRKCVFGIGDQLSKDAFERKVGVAARHLFGRISGSEFWAEKRPRKQQPSVVLCCVVPQTGLCFGPKSSVRDSTKK